MSININDLKDYIIPEQTLIFNGSEIMVKKYISQIQKVNITSQLVDIMYTPIEDESTFSNKDLKNTIFITLLIGSYTDINIDSDGIDYINTCEIAVSTGLYNRLLEIIPKTELDSLESLIKFNIDEKRHELLMERLSEIKAESLEMQLSRFLQMAIDRIPTEAKIQTLIKSVGNELKKFDPQKLQFLNDKVQEFGGNSTPTADSLTKIVDGVSQFVSKKD